MLIILMVLLGEPIRLIPRINLFQLPHQLQLIEYAYYLISLKLISHDFPLLHPQIMNYVISVIIIVGIIA